MGEGVREGMGTGNRSLVNVAAREGLQSPQNNTWLSLGVQWTHKAHLSHFLLHCCIMGPRIW